MPWEIYASDGVWVIRNGSGCLDAGGPADPPRSDGPIFDGDGGDGLVGLGHSGGCDDGGGGLSGNGFDGLCLATTAGGVGDVPVGGDEFSCFGSHGDVYAAM